MKSAFQVLKQALLLPVLVAWLYSSVVIFKRQKQFPPSPYPQESCKIKRCVADELLTVFSGHVPVVCGESPRGRV